MVTIVYYNRLSITFVKPSTVCESKNKMSSEETARQVLAQAPTGKGLASASASGSQGRVPPTSSGTTARGSPPRSEDLPGPRELGPSWAPRLCSCCGCSCRNREPQCLLPAC